MKGTRHGGVLLGEGRALAKAEKALRLVEEGWSQLCSTSQQLAQDFQALLRTIVLPG
jgi:hypothetical protein